MDKEKAVIWVFPISFCTIVFFLLFSITDGRPITGLIIGLVTGFIWALLSCPLYQDFYAYDVTKGFERGNCPPVNSFSDALMVPYYFFYMWLWPVFMIGGCLIKAALIIGAIAGGIYILSRLISAGY